MPTPYSRLCDPKKCLTIKNIEGFHFFFQALRPYSAVRRRRRAWGFRNMSRGKRARLSICFLMMASVWQSTGGNLATICNQASTTREEQKKGGSAAAAVTTLSLLLVLVRADRKLPGKILLPFFKI